MSIPQLVGHRGYPKHYPENTLCGLEATCPGGCFVEIDIQLTRDLVPVVIHDAGLVRTAGVSGDVRDMPYDRVKDVVVDERIRLGKIREEARLPALRDVVTWLGRRPWVRVFIELKAESLERFGRRTMIDRVLQELAPVLDRTAVISFDRDAVALVRRVSSVPVGWVLERWDGGLLAAAREFGPDYLFCDYTKIPGTVNELPAGVWRWVLYDITDPQLALDWARRGAALIETAAIGEMLAHPLLSRRACDG